MFIKNTSTKKYMRAKAVTILYIILFLAFPDSLKSEVIPEFDKPFKICRIYGNNSGRAQLVASDNENSIVFTNGNNYILSANPRTKLENWKSQTGGRLYPAIFSDGDSIFYLSSYRNESKDETFILNSISKKTGISNWQKKLSGYSNIKLFESFDKESIYLTSENKHVLAVRKKDGTINWVKNIQPAIISINTLSNELISILTVDSLIKLSTDSGKILYESKIKKNPTSNSIRNNSYLLLGYSNGEFMKISYDNGKVNDILWKIKAGGSISSVIEIEDEVLISSYDNFLYLYSTASGKLRWKRRVSGRINIKPLIIEKHAIVLSSSDNIASIVELEGGRIINQIKIEDGNYFSDEPILLDEFIIFPTFKGLYLYVNSDFDCN